MTPGSTTEPGSARPVNPHEHTGRTGLGGLWAYGEIHAADAMVTATAADGHRQLLMIQRVDGRGWALPGGCVEPGEDPAAAAIRELEEETGLRLPDAEWTVDPIRYVPDPRATDEAWLVATFVHTELGALEQLPAVVGADDAAHAAWIPADTYDVLVDELADRHDGATVFAMHVELLAAALGRSTDSR